MAIIYRGKNFFLEKSKTAINGRTFIFDRIVNKEVVVIIPILNGKLMLERQKRPVINKTIIELPAGHIEKGENPKITAARELEEETGYIPTKIKHMLDTYTAPGLSTQLNHYFLADKFKKGRINRDKDESMKIFFTNIDAAIKMIKDKRIKDEKTILGILLLKNKKSLFSK